MSQNARVRRLIQQRDKRFTFERLSKENDIERHVRDSRSYAGWLQSANSDVISGYLARGIRATHVLYLHEHPGDLDSGDRVIGEVSGIERTMNVLSSAEDVAGVSALWMLVVQTIDA